MVDDARAVPGTSLMLKPQELILTLVGEYVSPGAPVWSGGLVRIMQDLDFTSAGARVALNRVVSRGLFNVAKEGRLVYYSATPRLTALLAEGHRQTFWFRYASEAWDGRWTVVWYAIPEDRLLARRRLSRRLGFMGFSSMRDGTWLAPHDRSDDIRAVVDELGMRDYVVVFVGHAPGWLSTSTVLGHAWDLGEVANRYAALVDEFGRYSSARVRSRLRPSEAFTVRTLLIESVRQVAPLDPKVPESELDRPSGRERAIDLFNNLEAALRPAAQEHFTTVVDPRA